ncbi:hypothetical protein DRW07_12250 [Alteromonas sediminis]|uniref:histidine kinase n=1 Tax=Alteromonas sediminis TaxID=2259342 RepID=A0A3N5YKU0_9ALTE|nr:ATP-binding protein [Alteromonas sediminis]RPJ65591.1 hypothetical protein DRW07_12250 [Alteromonas sediminis]
MSRLFISLYVFVAISILVLGIGLEKLLINKQSAQTPAQKAILSLVTANRNQPDTLLKLLRQAGAKTQVYPASQFSPYSTHGAALENNEVIQGIADDDWLILIPTNQDTVVQARFANTKNSSMSWILYSTLFFGFLGVAIAIWVVPIWRDLRKLSTATETLQKDGTLEVPKIPAHSPLQPLVEGYNALNSNIKTLLHQHKALAGAITHEFKTPLARLRFALVSPGQYDKKQIQAIRADITELEHLVQEMLDFTRLDVHEPDLHIEDIPIQALCEQRLSKFRPGTSITLECVADNVTLLADATLLTRAIDNLLANALRHAKARVRIAVSIMEHVVISVEDDGDGVPDSDKEKVFEPFYRADTHRSRQHGGTGLGLAIVQRIMHWHKGTCSVTNSALGGAAFMLKFDARSHRL